MLGWLAGSLLVCTLAYSFVTILHQAWGTRWGGQPAWRARVTAWREGATLAGVLLASVLPAVMGLDATGAVLALGLALGLMGLYRLRAPVAPVLPVPLVPQPAGPASAALAPAASPWADAAFRRLLAIFMLNGVAAAVPATLLPFFVADRLQAPALQPLLLLCFFGAAALGLPLWVKAVSRWGLAPSWRAGMLASVLAFGFTPWLGAGDGMAFALIDPRKEVSTTRARNRLGNAVGWAGCSTTLSGRTPTSRAAPGSKPASAQRRLASPMRTWSADSAVAGSRFMRPTKPAANWLTGRA